MVMRASPQWLMIQNNNICMYVYYYYFLLIIIIILASQLLERYTYRHIDKYIHRDRDNHAYTHTCYIRIHTYIQQEEEEEGGEGRDRRCWSMYST